MKPTEIEVPTPAAAVVNPRRLLRRFVLLSLASMALMFLLVTVGFYRISRQIVIDGAKVSSVAVAESIFAQERRVLLQATPDGWSRIGVAAAEMTGLDLRMRKYLNAFGMVKVKLYDLERKIVYSTDASIIGLVDSANSRLERVLRLGKVDVELVTKDRITDLLGQELFQVDVVETYIPAILDGDIVGSFEVYVDVTPTYAAHFEHVRYFAIAFLVLLVVTFSVLYALMRQGTNRLSYVQDALRDLASTDVLTGLFNRRHLFDRIGEEYSRLARAGIRREPKESIGFIMIDIDHFKKINDTFGHQGGDAVLRETSARLKSLLRSYDVIGRYGGEEFLVMLPHTDLAGSRVVAERMRHRIADAPFDVAGKSIDVTVSLGVSHSGDAQGDMMEVINRADECLYRAKNAGRNQVAWEG